MKHLKIAGLCLVAVFVMGMVVSASASAAPTWEQCRTEKEPKEPPTRWSDSKCSVASSTGAWQWRELKTTEQVEGSGTLTLKDSKASILGSSAVTCGGIEKGSIGPGRFDRVTTIEVKVSNCKNVEHCSEIKRVVPLNLPWQTELFETEGKKRDKITETGNGQPGWEIECKEIVTVTDKCTSEPGKEGAPIAENKQSVGNVQIKFDEKVENAFCTLSKELTGSVRGAVQTISTEGWAIRVQ